MFYEYKFKYYTVMILNKSKARDLNLWVMTTLGHISDTLHISFVTVAKLQ